MSFTAIFSTFSSVFKVALPFLVPDPDKDLLRLERRYEALCKIEEIKNKSEQDHHAIAQIKLLYPMAGYKRLPLSVAESLHEYLALFDYGTEHSDVADFLRCGGMLEGSGKNYALDKKTLKSARFALIGGGIAYGCIVVLFILSARWLIADALLIKQLSPFFLPLVGGAIALLGLCYLKGARQEWRAYANAEAFWCHFRLWMTDRAHCAGEKSNDGDENGE